MTPSLDPHPIPGGPAKVLLGIEQEWAARSIESVLAPHGMAVIRAYSGGQTLELAETIAPDVILVDSRLSDIDGIEVCHRLRSERQVGPHVPVVLVTSGPMPRESILAAHRAGAWAVWEQPFDAEVVLLRARCWIEAKRMVDDARAASLVDDMTGLYSYRGMAIRAQEVLADAVRRATPTSCIAFAPGLRAGVAPDSFASNEVLEAIGHTLRRAARASDVVGRVGHAEFVVLAPATTEAGALDLGQRLQSAVQSLPARIPHRLLRTMELRFGAVTIGVGAARESDPGSLLHRASTALRHAERSPSADVGTAGDMPIALR